MKKRGMFVVGAGALALIAVAGMQGSALDSFAQTLNGAKGLDVAYTMTTVGGKTNNYTVSLAKPNKARIETPTTLIVADGKTVVRHMKADGIFYKKEQTDAELLSIFADEGLSMWSPFFDAKAAPFANAKDAGTRARRGVNFKVVNADLKGAGKATFYVDPGDYLAKQAEIVSNTGGRETTTIYNATKASLTAPKDSLFVFNAPSGAKEVTESDLVAGKWMASFEEAVTAAKAQNKLILVDFMADWCGPCKMMEAEVFTTPEFKELTKDMVLVKVDVDVRTDLASKYGIEAMPTTKFVNGNGQIVHEFVGYGGFNHVMGEIKTAKSKFGK